MLILLQGYAELILRDKLELYLHHHALNGQNLLRTQPGINLNT